MMYRGVPGTGTPLITDLDEPPATGPIVGYSHQAIANLYTYARNNPINLVDPSGLDPEFMTREWFQWFARWDIPSYQLKKNPEWDARLTREADELFDEVDAIAKKVLPDTPTAEARRQALLAVRAYNEQHSRGIGAIQVDSNADPAQARTNAQTEMEENMILAGEGWWTRQFHMFMIPGSANPNPLNFDTLIAAVAAGRVAQVGLKKVAVQTPFSPNATPKRDSKAVATAVTGGKKVSLDLFGGRKTQNSGSVLVDIAAEEGVKADATRLPFASNAVDEIIASNPFIQGGKGIGDWLPEAARVLKPGSRLYINSTVRNPFGQVPDAETLESLGLRVVQKTGPLDARFQNQVFRFTDGRQIPNTSVKTSILQKVEQRDPI